MPQPRSTTRRAGSRQVASTRKSKPESKPFGRLVRCSIDGLFGQPKQSFDLPADGPAILTGPNGSGKSTILKTINAIGNKEWLALMKLPFKMIALKFEEGPQLVVSRTADGLKVTRGRESWGIGGDDPRGLGADIARLAALVDRTEWERLAPGERARHVHYRRMLQERMERIESDAPEWIREPSQLFPVLFITDQRLVVHGSEDRSRGPSEEEARRAVSEYGRQLGRLMSTWLELYAKASQQEDRRFPVEVINAMSTGEDVDKDNLESLVSEVGLKRLALEQVGLVEPGESGAPAPAAESAEDDPAIRIVIKTFAEVTLRKFATIEPFRRRLQLLVDFLNAHFVGKQALTAPGEDGLLFRLPDGQLLRPGQLSSGEQQMFVLAYQILFEVDPGTLLLIDEPEISLHVLWQNQLIDDLTVMGAANGIQFLLATHSPTLIGGREELRRALTVGEPR